eukprot:524-Pyramimonas_sp.AAC.1
MNPWGHFQRKGALNIRSSWRGSPQVRIAIMEDRKQRQRLAAKPNNPNKSAPPIGPAPPQVPAASASGGSAEDLEAAVDLKVRLPGGGMWTGEMKYYEGV